MKVKGTIKAQVQPVVMPLYICGYCGTDTRKGLCYQIQKVIISGYANMLCEVCQTSLEYEIAQIARKYLDKPA